MTFRDLKVNEEFDFLGPGNENRWGLVFRKISARRYVITDRAPIYDDYKNFSGASYRADVNGAVVSKSDGLCKDARPETEGVV